MSLQTFFDNFALLADAPNGVQKLRELILQLAVEGKLVSQNPNDETASALLERIRKEKDELVRQGKIKLTQVSLIEESEAPYGVPHSWAWTSLESVGLINPRNEFEDGAPASFVPMNLVPQNYGERVKTETRLWKEIKKGFTHFAEGDVVLAKITPCFQNGKAAVMRGLKNNIGAGTTELHVFRPIVQTIYPDYVLVYLKSPNFILEGIPRMTGSAGQKRVPNDYFARNPFPLPPLEEQKRIVAKVDELMRLCDELEAQQQARRESRVRLNNATLAPLKNAASLAPEELEQASARLADNFDALYNSAETVSRLRSTILQLAVQGKLVPQDPHDEPASALLKKVKLEKEQLLRNKNIKKADDLPSIERDEMEYQIPKTWHWARLADLCEFITDGTHQTPKYTESGRIFLSAQNVKPFMFKPYIYRHVSEEDYQGYIKSRKPEFEDILLTRVGAGIGEAAVINIDIEFAFYVSIALIRPLKKYINPHYLTVWLNSPSGTQKSISNTYGKGMSQGNLNLGLIRKFVVSIPPLEEQKRIVAKVNQLMALCDELETKLRQAEEDSVRLMKAALQHVLASINQASQEESLSVLA